MQARLCIYTADIHIYMYVEYVPQSSSLVQACSVPVNESCPCSKKASNIPTLRFDADTAFKGPSTSTLHIWAPKYWYDSPFKTQVSTIRIMLGPSTHCHNRTLGPMNLL